MQPKYPYILLADDDPDDLQAFTDEFIYQHPGITVRQVSSGREVLLHLDICPDDRLPTLLVLDYQMPELTGFEVLQALAANDRYAPIVKVVWSNCPRTKDREECIRLGATLYLAKPGTIEELKRTIHQLLDIFETAAQRRPHAGLPTQHLYQAPLAGSAT